MRSKRSEKLKSQFRPNIFDLQWEVVRRNPRYRKDYRALKENPELAKKPLCGKGPVYFKDRWTALAYKFNLSKAADPSRSWEKFRVPPPKGATMIKKARGTLFLPDDSAIIPVLPFRFKLDQEQPIWATWKGDPSRYLFLKIDPFANEDVILNLIKRELKIFKGNYKKPPAKINERIKWLRIVDVVQKKKLNPDRETFEETYFIVCRAGLIDKPKILPSYRDLDRMIDRYAQGVLLIMNPFNDPLRQLSKDELASYQSTHNLMPKNSPYSY